MIIMSGIKLQLRKDAGSVCRNSFNSSTCWSSTNTGYVPFSKAGAQLLFEVVDPAYEHHNLMIATNLPRQRSLAQKDAPMPSWTGSPTDVT